MIRTFDSLWNRQSCPRHNASEDPEGPSQNARDVVAPSQAFQHGADTNITSIITPPMRQNQYRPSRGGRIRCRRFTPLAPSRKPQVAKNTRRFRPCVRRMMGPVDAGDRSQETGVRSQESGDRSQESGGRRQESVDSRSRKAAVSSGTLIPPDLNNDPYSSNRDFSPEYSPRRHGEHGDKDFDETFRSLRLLTRSLGRFVSNACF
jgi:hypothetical protein